jgi:hypothetical protein
MQARWRLIPLASAYLVPLVLGKTVIAQEGNALTGVRETIQHVTPAKEPRQEAPEPARPDTPR